MSFVILQNTKQKKNENRKCQMAAWDLKEFKGFILKESKKQNIACPLAIISSMRANCWKSPKIRIS